MASFGSVTPNTLAEGAQQEQGENARMASFMGAYAICDLVKTTLGPKGMDKILQSMNGDITVTNDGATILRRLTLDNPAAKILVDISKTQDEEVGDGTTTVCILAGALLAEADPLLSQQIHPQTIIEGWRLALKAARTALEVIRVLPTSRARTRPCTARCPQYRLAPPRARPCRKGRDVSN